MQKLLVGVCVLAMFGCGATAVPETEQVSVEVSEPATSAISSGLTHLYYTDWDGPRIPVWVYVPHDVEPATAPIMIMMHGARRGAARYLASWDQVADAEGFIVIAPEFNREDFPGSPNYNQGRVFVDESLARQPEDEWTFSRIEPIFDWVAYQLGSSQDHFTLYGHSAGSQFTHRFMYFKPDAPVDRYLPANAGWYTMPDLNTPWPYGLGGTGVSEADLIKILEKDVVVLLGDADNDANHESLRRTDGANAQGAHRFARGLTFFETAEAQAEALGADFGWQMRVFPGVAHSNGDIAAGSGDLID